MRVSICLKNFICQYFLNVYIKSFESSGSWHKQGCHIPGRYMSVEHMNAKSEKRTGAVPRRAADLILLVASAPSPKKQTSSDGLSRIRIQDIPESLTWFTTCNHSYKAVSPSSQALDQAEITPIRPSILQIPASGSARSDTSSWEQAIICYVSD